MQATVKVHSSLHKYFDQTEFRADFNTYHDLIPYFSAMHPRFNHYMRMINWGESNEGFAFLDKNLNLITEEELHIKRVHEGDTIYLAPVIVGGGGKKGGMLALAAIIAISIIAPPVGGTALSGGGGAAAAAKAGTAAATKGGIFASFSAMPSFAQSLFLNVGMSMISSLFTKKKKPMETDTSTRAGGAFGPLTNSTQSGTPPE